MPMRWPAGLTIVLTMLALAAGCMRPAQAPAVSAAAAPDAALAALAPPGPTLGALRAGDLLVWLSSKPGVPARGMADMDAYLVQSSGQPVADAKVWFDADMTNMSHGPYRVTARPAGSGHYTGQVRFLMGGPWRVIVIVERPGQETVRLRFEFRVKS